MANEPGPYTLIQDDDCHWYVCSAARTNEAAAYFDAVSRYWSPGSESEGDPPEEPDWLERVGGAPSLVLFSSYSIRVQQASGRRD